MDPAVVGHGRVALEQEQDVEPPQCHRAVDVEEVERVQAAGLRRRNCCEMASVCRNGAGAIRWRLRIRRIVEAPTPLLHGRGGLLSPLHLVLGPPSAPAPRPHRTALWRPRFDRE
jgi:hypothetical protein